MLTDDELDLDFDAMTDDEVIAFLMRHNDITYEEAVQNWREACGAVQAAAEALFAACAEGVIEATGINIKTGKREVIPPCKFVRQP